MRERRPEPRNTKLNEIRLGAYLSYITIAFNIAMGLVYTPWIIRQIGQSEYGLYGIAISVVGMVSMDFGLGNAVARFVAKYRAEDREDEISNFLGIAIKAYFVIDAVIVTVLFVIWLLLDKIYISLTPIEINKLSQIFIVLILYTAISFPFQALNGVITAREKFIFQKSVDFFNKLFTVIFTVMALYTGGRLLSLVLVNAIVGIITAFLKWVYLKNNRLLAVSLGRMDRALVKEVFSFSAWVTIIKFFQLLMLNITPTILGVTSGTHEISIFTAANNIYGYVYNLSGAISGLFISRVSVLMHSEQGRLGDVQELMAKVGRVQLLIMGAVFAVFVPLGRQFVILWLGENFEKTYYVGILLIAPLLITSTLTIAETVLTVKGKLQYEVIAYAAAASIAFPFSAVTSRYMGAIGSGIGLFLGYLVGNAFVRSIIYKKIADIDMCTFYNKCHLSFVPTIVLTILAGIIIKLALAYGGWGWFIAKCVMVLFIYLLLFLLITANGEEKNYIRSIFRKLRI